MSDSKWNVEPCQTIPQGYFVAQLGDYGKCWLKKLWCNYRRGINIKQEQQSKSRYKLDNHSHRSDPVSLAATVTFEAIFVWTDIVINILVFKWNVFSKPRFGSANRAPQRWIKSSWISLTLIYPSQLCIWRLWPSAGAGRRHPASVSHTLDH